MKCSADEAALTSRVLDLEADVEIQASRCNKDITAAETRAQLTQAEAAAAKYEHDACQKSIELIEANAAEARRNRESRLQETLEAMTAVRNAQAGEEMRNLTRQNAILRKALTECERNVNSSQVAMAPEMCQEKMLEVSAEVAKAKATQKGVLCTYTQYDDLLFEAETVRREADAYVRRTKLKGDHQLEDAQQSATAILEDTRLHVPVTAAT